MDGAYAPRMFFIGLSVVEFCRHVTLSFKILISVALIMYFCDEEKLELDHC